MKTILINVGNAGKVAGFSQLLFVHPVSRGVTTETFGNLRKSKILTKLIKKSFMWPRKAYLHFTLPPLKLSLTFPCLKLAKIFRQLIFCLKKELFCLFYPIWWVTPFFNGFLYPKRADFYPALIKQHFFIFIFCCYLKE